MVIDEADRLLAHSFQNWLVRVLAATQSTQSSQTICSTDEPLDCLWPDGVAPIFMPNRSVNPLTYIPEEAQSSCQKLLLSATLTRDPEKIAALSLRNPKYFVVQDTSRQRDAGQSGVLDVVMEKFSVPASLSVSKTREIRWTND